MTVCSTLHARHPRPATREDLDLLEDLERRCFERPWSRALLLAELQLPGSYSWIFADPGHAAGYAIVRVGPETGELLRLGVVPEARRRGVARRLVSTAVEGVRRAGIEELLLEVRADNVPAIELYRGLGFAPFGRRRSYYEDRTDAVLWRLDLRRAARLGSHG